MIIFTIFCRKPIHENIINTRVLRHNKRVPIIQIKVCIYFPEKKYNLQNLIPIKVIAFPYITIDYN